MNESTIIYKSAYTAINYLPTDELKWEAINGLLRYGFFGEDPVSENPFVNMVYVQAIPSMRASKERYERAVEGGRFGGRPPTVSQEEVLSLKEEGKTNKEIAEKLGCSEKNIERIVTKSNKLYPTNPINLYPTNPTNPTNLTYTSSYTDTYTDTYTSSYTETNNRVANATTKEEEGANATKRTIKDLTSQEGDDIVKKIKHNVKYVDIQKEYNLEFGSITKDFPKQWQEEKKNRSYWEEYNAELERMKKDKIDYKYYETCVRKNRESKPEQDEHEISVQNAMEEFF